MNANLSIALGQYYNLCLFRGLPENEHNSLWPLAVSTNQNPLQTLTKYNKAILFSTCDKIQKIAAGINDCLKWKLTAGTMKNIITSSSEIPGTKLSLFTSSTAISAALRAEPKKALVEAAHRKKRDYRATIAPPDLLDNQLSWTLSNGGQMWKLSYALFMTKVRTHAVVTVCSQTLDWNAQQDYGVHELFQMIWDEFEEVFR